MGRLQDGKVYIGVKVIEAAPMNQMDFGEKIRPFPDPVLVDGQGRSPEGYMVLYPDGYVSWSPKEVFEAAYREIGANEAALIDER